MAACTVLDRTVKLVQNPLTSAGSYGKCVITCGLARSLQLASPGTPVLITQNGMQFICSAWPPKTCTGSTSCDCANDPRIESFSPAVVCGPLSSASIGVPRPLEFCLAISVVFALKETRPDKRSAPIRIDELDRATQGQLIHALKCGLYLKQGVKIYNPGLLCLEALVVYSLPGECIVKCTRNTHITFSNGQGEDENQTRAQTLADARLESVSNRPASKAAARLRSAVLLPFMYKQKSLILAKGNGSGVVSYNGILVYGPSGVGKTYAIHETIQELELMVMTRLFTLNNSSKQSEEESLRNTLRSARRCVESNTSCIAIVLLEDIDRLCPKRGEGNGTQASLVAQLLVFLDGVKGLERLALIATTTNPNTLDPALRRPGRFDFEVCFDPPSEHERALLLAKMLSKSRGITDEQIVLLAKSTAGFFPADLSAAICRAQPLASEDRYHNAYEKLKTALAMEENPGIFKRRSKGGSKEATGWSDIGGYDDVKLVLRQVLEWPAKHDRAMKRFRIRQTRGVLLHGPPGCCKTTFARVAASSSGCSFLCLSGADIYSAFIGESERILREAFADARAAAPCVLFFDEFDAIVGTRSLKMASNLVGQSRILATFLNEMDGIESAPGVLVLAATNRIDHVDKALLRPGRFDRVIQISLPDEKERFLIFETHLSKIPISSDVKIDYLAASSQGLSGAEIANVCKEASMIALRIKAGRVCQSHLVTALVGH